MEYHWSSICILIDVIVLCNIQTKTVLILTWFFTLKGEIIFFSEFCQQFPCFCSHFYLCFCFVFLFLFLKKSLIEKKPYWMSNKCPENLSKRWIDKEQQRINFFPYFTFMFFFIYQFYYIWIFFSEQTFQYNYCLEGGLGEYKKNFFG